MSAWVFCKSCRMCYEFAKKQREEKVNETVQVPTHCCCKNFAKICASKETEPRAVVLITKHVVLSNNGVFLESIVIDSDATTMTQLHNNPNG
eukprot:4890794-Ditylum_brightwellii.AAC.1